MARFVRLTRTSNNQTVIVNMDKVRIISSFSNDSSVLEFEGEEMLFAYESLDKIMDIMEDY